MAKPVSNLRNRHFRSPAGLCRVLWVVAVALAITSLGQEAPPAAESDALLAAFVYNFCLFTEWPPPAPGAERPDFVLAVAGRPFPALAALSKRKVGGHQVRIVQLGETESLPSACDVLFCSGLGTEARAEILGQTSSRPILTLSPDPGFCQAGGMVEFFVRDARMRFRISLANLNQTKLHISSQLLKLAEAVPAAAGGN